MTSAAHGKPLETLDCVAAGARALADIEPRFAGALEATGPLPLRRSEGGYAGLLRIVCDQQLSVAAGRAIWARVEEAGATTPEAVQAADDDALRALGLSRPKIRTARAVAEAVAAGDLCFMRQSAAPYPDAFAELVAIKGVGPWTAEIYHMFCEGRPDVFAPGDLALQEAARALFALDARPTAKALGAMAEAWSPWRAVAARALWAYYRVLKNREGVR